MVDVGLTRDELEFINILMCDLIYSNFNIRFSFESKRTMKMICSIKNKTTKLRM